MGSNQVVPYLPLSSAILTKFEKMAEISKSRPGRDSRPNLRISFKSEASLRDTLVSRSKSVRLPFQKTSSALKGNVI